MKTLRLVYAFTAAVIAPIEAGAQGTPCEEHSGFHQLDFWVGEWNVHSGGRQVGENRIEKILSGCAVMEHWTSANGSEGMSLFYYNAVTDTWRQIWVTENALRRGGLKEKQLIAVMEDGGVRFQGEIPAEGGGIYYDRTTLTPLDDGSVRQLIEWSADGESWNVSFDANYVRRE